MIDHPCDYSCLTSHGHGECWEATNFLLGGPPWRQGFPTWQLTGKKAPFSTVPRPQRLKAGGWSGIPGATWSRGGPTPGKASAPSPTHRFKMFHNYDLTWPGQPITKLQLESPGSLLVLLRGFAVPMSCHQITKKLAAACSCIRRAGIDCANACEPQLLGGFKKHISQPIQ